jgi:CRISPR-associated protein Cas2
MRRQLVNIVVTYDVATDTREGRRRLRKVAQLCTNYGQRVQLSVFECRLGLEQLEQLKQGLVTIIHATEDSVRIYQLSGDRGSVVWTAGRDSYRDFDDPLIL